MMQPALSRPPALDVASPESLRDPELAYQRLREEDPVHWSEVAKAWFIMRYEDVTSALRDPRLSSARLRAVLEHDLDGQVDLARDFERVSRSSLMLKDGPDHARLRRHASEGFGSAAIEAYTPVIARVTDELLYRVRGRGRMDLVADLSGPLPSLVMAEIFDIPAEDRAKFQVWSADIARFFGSAIEDVEEAARRANEGTLGHEEYLSRVIEQRRGSRGDDMVSRLLRYEEEGRMDARETVTNLILILIAGHVTTIDQMSNAVYDLLTHPDELGRLRASPELVKGAVEESMRYNPAVPFTNRVAVEDIPMRGRLIRKGQLVFLGLASANRDPSVFPEPDLFDITRQNNKHLAFGFGAHACLGAPLARRELVVGLSMLLERMPGLRLDPDKPPRRKREALIFRGFYELPLLF